MGKLIIDPEDLKRIQALARQRAEADRLALPDSDRARLIACQLAWQVRALWLQQDGGIFHRGCGLAVG
jgi:hypothetical protein